MSSKDGEHGRCSEIPRLIQHPLSIAGNSYPISCVLDDLASQECCDSAEHDMMVAAARYIDDLEKEVIALRREA